MFPLALSLILGTLATHVAQVADGPEPGIQQHIRNIIAELPADSTLRRELSSGARGDGMHQPWMDDMRAEGIKRVVVQIGIHFDRHGRAKRLVLKDMEFFTEYDAGTPVSDAAKLNNIRSRGLEQTLGDLALKRAAHGIWIDVPRPRPEPFDGGARLEFFDDQWLPTAGRPLYCAGKSCIPESETQQ
jgi:hypothetical protein